jgi:membrane-associated phospholipid phosphatase
MRARDVPTHLSRMTACALAVRAAGPPTAGRFMDSRDSPLPHASWLRQIGPRMRTRWPAKFIGTTLGMTAFFVVYFWLLHHPFFPITTMPLTVVDRWIPFWPGALVLYVSLWFYVSFAPALLTESRELFSYLLATAVLSVIGLGIFLFWPTAVPVLAESGPQHPFFFILQKVDASGNACPSLHVAFAVFTAFWFQRLLREMRAGRVVRALNWLWCVGILYSTIATRQHVALDVLAGAVLGAAVAAVHLRLVGSSDRSAPLPTLA